MSTAQRIGIIMYGVTGRMGTNQHLVRSILASLGDQIVVDEDELLERRAHHLARHFRGNGGMNVLRHPDDRAENRLPIGVDGHRPRRSRHRPRRSRPLPVGRRDP